MPSKPVVPKSVPHNEHDHVECPKYSMNWVAYISSSIWNLSKCKTWDRNHHKILTPALTMKGGAKWMLP